MNRFGNHPALIRALRKLGIDPVQYALLIDLFRKLSRRQEFEVGSSSFSLRTTVGMFAAFSGFINLIVAFGPRPPLRAYVFGNFIFTTFLVVLILTMEAVNTFLNPVEASALAHQPIRDSSYLAAKLTFLGIVVGYVVFPINVLPALAGLNLNGASWFYPLTYLAASYLLGLFIALMGCGALGLLFRILPVARVRNTILWVQIGFFVLIGSASSILRAFRGVGTNVNVANLGSLPLNWFVALVAPVPNGIAMFATVPAILSMGACAVFIAFGLKSLSHGYLARVHSLLRSGPSHKPARGAILGAAIRMITGKPSGRAGFAFVYGMARTDWQFRRAVYPGLIQFLILPLIGLARAGLGQSPFRPGPPTVAQFLPHIGGLMGLLFCYAIRYSDQHRAAWIFLTFPADNFRSFVRGVFWAMWFPLNALSVLAAPFIMWYWGIADAALFIVYSIAVGTFYLSLEIFMIDGLPFANPPERMKGSMAAPLVVAALVGALIIVGLQWIFIFQSRFVTAGAILVFIGAAYVIAKTSLRYLEVNVQHNLHVIATGRTAMFKEVG